MQALIHWVTTSCQWGDTVNIIIIVRDLSSGSLHLYRSQSSEVVIKTQSNTCMCDTVFKSFPTPKGLIPKMKYFQVNVLSSHCCSGLWERGSGGVRRHQVTVGVTSPVLLSPIGSHALGYQLYKAKYIFAEIWLFPSLMTTHYIIYYGSTWY